MIRMNSRILIGFGILFFILLFLSANFAQVSVPAGSPNFWGFFNGNIFNTYGLNVGIGLMNPVQKLDVAGGIKISSTGPKPICDAKNEGTIWFTKNAPPTASLMEVCINQGGSGGGTDTLTVKSAKLPVGRRGLSCAYSPQTSKIYCFGGYIPSTAEIDEYDYVADTLKVKLSTLPSAAGLLSCVNSSLNGKIYCFGGYGSNQVVEYDPINDSVNVKPTALPGSRNALSCAESSFNNHIYCFGGVSTPTNYDQILEYDPSTDTLFTKAAKLTVGMYSLSCSNSKLTNKIYCFGGSNNVSGYNQTLVQEYDPQTDTLIQKTASTGAYYYASCVENASSNLIHCLGGLDPVGALNKIFTYNPLTDSITYSALLLPSPSYLLSCAYSTSAYCFGGSDLTSNWDYILEYSSSTSNGSYVWKRTA